MTNSSEATAAIFGSFDENIKRIEKKYSVSVTSHGSQIKVKGEPESVAKACRTIEGLITMINKIFIILIFFVCCHS